VQLGAKVALVEKDRIGEIAPGPAAYPAKPFESSQGAHLVRTASQYGIMSQTPVTDMAKVQGVSRRCDFQQIYKATTPEELRQKGMDVYLGPARFVDRLSIVTGDKAIRSKHFLITNRRSAIHSQINGLDSVPYLTYEHSSTTSVCPAR